MRHHVPVADGQECDGDEPHGTQEVTRDILLVVVPAKGTQGLGQGQQQEPTPARGWGPHPQLLLPTSYNLLQRYLHPGLKCSILSPWCRRQGWNSAAI